MFLVLLLESNKSYVSFISWFLFGQFWVILAPGWPLQVPSLKKGYSPAGTSHQARWLTGLQWVASPLSVRKEPTCPGHQDTKEKLRGAATVHSAPALCHAEGLVINHRSHFALCTRQTPDERNKHDSQMPSEKRKYFSFFEKRETPNPAEGSDSVIIKLSCMFLPSWAA